LDPKGLPSQEKLSELTIGFLHCSEIIILVILNDEKSFKHSVYFVGLSFKMA